MGLLPSRAVCAVADVSGQEVSGRRKWHQHACCSTLATSNDIREPSAKLSRLYPRHVPALHLGSLLHLLFCSLLSRPLDRGCDAFLHRPRRPFNASYLDTPVFLLSLPRSVDRRARCEPEIRKHTSSLTVVQPFDGRQPIPPTKVLRLS